mmetsp:Transcript_35675/g.76064  ORF Transcript_35675/g.76064 Transcript_35675/m.76064 type:complete len:612 (+) Transcript_35675:219-2054(+)
MAVTQPNMPAQYFEQNTVQTNNGPMLWQQTSCAMQSMSMGVHAQSFSTNQASASLNSLPSMSSNSSFNSNSNSNNNSSGNCTAFFPMNNMNNMTNISNMNNMSNMSNVNSGGAGTPNSAMPMMQMTMPTPVSNMSPSQSPQGMFMVPVMMVPVFVPNDQVNGGQMPQQFVMDSQQQQQQPQGYYAQGDLREHVCSQAAAGPTQSNRSWGDVSDSTDVPGSPRSEDEETPMQLQLPQRTPTATSARNASCRERLTAVSQRAAMMTQRPIGQDRSTQVANMLTKYWAHDVQFSWVDINLSVKGLHNVRHVLVQFCDNMPDLQMQFENIVEEAPNKGIMEYIMSGTQTKMVLPQFAVGMWTQWKVTGSYHFDQAGKIKIHHMQFGFLDGVPATEAQYRGLAQCAETLVTTPGGSRLLQKAIEMDAENDEAKALLLEPLAASVWKSSLSPHGNHVLQKLITSMYSSQVQFIVDAFRGNAVEAAQNQMQSRVLERLLEYCPEEMAMPLVDEMLTQCHMLLRHPFGNFVMQAVLEHGCNAQKSYLARAIAEDVDRLARHKIASNSVRKALMHCVYEDQLVVVNSIRGDAQRFAALSKHKTGSFVVREMKHVVKSWGA